MPSTSLFSLILSPKMLFTCPEAIVMAAAEVNPDMTGKDMKSMTMPSLKRPRPKVMKPDKNVSKMTKTGPLLAYCDVIRAIMAVGPMVMSFDVPRNMYTKHPIKAEYSPY